MERTLKLQCVLGAIVAQGEDQVSEIVTIIQVFEKRY